MSKVVLAYTGGLATSLCIHWLKHTKNLTVVTYSANLGQGGDLEPMGEHAIELGAEAAHIGDLRDRLVEEFVFPTLRAGAMYESGYLLANALTRPLIAEELVRIAREEGCEYVAHGCTGKGNDQHRIEASLASLAPKLKIMVPLLEWGFKSTEEQLRFAESFGISPLKPPPEKYTVDVCLWGRGVASGPLEDPWQEPPEDVFEWTTPPEKAPSRPEYVTLRFEAGIPSAVNGEGMKPRKLVDLLNRVGGRHGVGRIDVLENRVVGIKSREVYEAPAATLLTLAHQALEDLTLSKDLLHYKRHLAQRYSELVYDGMWFTRLRGALGEFFDATQECVTGEVRLKLFKGSARVAGRRSDLSLYDPALARRRMVDSFGYSYAKGFFDIWKLPQQQEALQKKKLDPLATS
jgi:argininosuccinate synthase